MSLSSHDNKSLCLLTSTVFPNLVQTLNGGLHMMVILFLLVAVGFALVSLSFSVYNTRKVPYQSIKGHKGLYLWNLIAGICEDEMSYFQYLFPDSSP